VWCHRQRQETSEATAEASTEEAVAVASSRPLSFRVETPEEAFACTDNHGGLFFSLDGVDGPQ
jgi:hypothetical protein